MNIDFETILKELDESTTLLNEIDIVSKIGFTEQQAKYINLITVEALKKYHKAVISALVTK